MLVIKSIMYTITIDAFIWVENTRRLVGTLGSNTSESVKLLFYTYFVKIFDMMMHERQYSSQQRIDTG